VNRLYLSMECDRREDDMFRLVGTTITHNGLPVVPYDFASQETFDCDNCGAVHYLGDFDYLVEGSGEETDDDEPAEATR
jgi:hypothetical protein